MVIQLVHGISIILLKLRIHFCARIRWVSRDFPTALMGLFTPPVFMGRFRGLEVPLWTKVIEHAISINVCCMTLPLGSWQPRNCHCQTAPQPGILWSKAADLFHAQECVECGVASVLHSVWNIVESFQGVAI